MPFEVGQEIGGYEFIEVLDTSGTGVTYKVRNPLAQRFEVLKILSKDLQKDRERVDRFLREVKIHARLTHPNIASFYSAMEIEGQLVMTMELVEGETLEQQLREGPIPVPTALDYGIQALAALEYAHNNGVIHRNISPSGIIVGPNGTIKVTEFDLAKTVSDPRLTLTGMVMGEMHYISPEQVKGLTTLDARTDIYSLGVVLYEMVTGRKPFSSKSQFEVMQAHVQLPPAPLSDLHPHLPAELDRAVLIALAKEPSERFQTAGEFRAALESVKKVPEGDPAVPAGLAQLSTAQTEVPDENIAWREDEERHASSSPFERNGEDDVMSDPPPPAATDENIAWREEEERAASSSPFERNDEGDVMSDPPSATAPDQNNAWRAEEKPAESAIPFERDDAEDMSPDAPPATAEAITLQAESPKPLAEKPPVPPSPAAPSKSRAERQAPLSPKKSLPASPAPNPIMVGIITFLVVTASFLLFLIIAEW